ncbi:MAG: hypothetical protein HQL41_11510 [Alphaproteobacteria bacterium]|nr:hypothetical protein [Alphaproteobacteria bacterium]
MMASTSSPAPPAMVTVAKAELGWVKVSAADVPVTAVSGGVVGGGGGAEVEVFSHQLPPGPVVAAGVDVGIGVAVGSFGGKVGGIGVEVGMGVAVGSIGGRVIGGCVIGGCVTGGWVTGGCVTGGMVGGGGAGVTVGVSVGTGSVL